MRLIDETEKLIFEETKESIDEVEIKSNIQSEGDLIIISKYLPYVFYFAVTLLILVGGEIELLKNIKFKTKGAYLALNKLFDGRTRRKEYAKNQEQNRKGQETVRKLIETNPYLIKESTEIVSKLLDNPTIDDLNTTQETSENE